MFLLISKNPYLHEHFDTFEFNEIYYLAYTDDEDLAERYADQFIAKDVYYVEVTTNFVEGIKKYIHIPITPLNLLTSEDETKDIVLSDSDMSYLDEVLSDCAQTEFDDLLFTIENLSRFKNRYVQKTVKRLERLLEIFNMEIEGAEDSFQNIIDSEDLAEHYIFLAKRLHIFERNLNYD